MRSASIAGWTRLCQSQMFLKAAIWYVSVVASPIRNDCDARMLVLTSPSMRSQRRLRQSAMVRELQQHDFSISKGRVKWLMWWNNNFPAKHNRRIKVATDLKPNLPGYQICWIVTPRQTPRTRSVHPTYLPMDRRSVGRTAMKNHAVESYPAPHLCNDYAAILAEFKKV